MSAIATRHAIQHHARVSSVGGDGVGTASYHVFGIRSLASTLSVAGRVLYVLLKVPQNGDGIFLIIIIITTTIFIVLSSTALALCESSLWFLWAKVGQRQVAANS